MSEQLDTGALPMTEPHPAPFFDTGPHPEPLVSYESDALDFTPLLDSAPMPRVAGPVAILAEHNPISGPVRVPVPTAPASVKRWKFALMLAGVWLLAAAAGAGLYYWWFHSIDKTWPEAGVLLFVIVSMVAALLVSMAERPMLAGLSVALMAVPGAAACGAAALYGAYAFSLLAP